MPPLTRQSLPRWSRWSRRAVLVLAAVAICAPVWLGVWHALADGAAVGATRTLPGMPPAKLDSASFPWWRFIASAFSALGAGALSLLLGWPMARGLASSRGVVRAALLGLSLTLLVVPAFVLARGVQAFTVLLGWPTLFVPVFQVGGTADPLAGALGVVLVGALNGWPIAGLLMGIGLRSRRPSELDLVALLPVVPGGEWRRRNSIWRISASRLAPYALIAAAVVALRMFLDDATPSLLGQRSFAREIQIACDTDGGVGPTALPFAAAALALTLPLVLLAIVLGRRAHLIDAAHAPERATSASARRTWPMTVAWLAMLAASLGLPLVALAVSPHAPIPWGKIAVERYDALYGSAWLCTNTALIASAFGVLLATLHHAESFRLVRGIVWLALALAFAWPPHPAAFGLLTLQPPHNWSHGALRTFDLARLALLRVPASAQDAALTSGLPWRTRWRVLHMWPTLRAAMLAGLAVGLLALVERESSEVLFVPGFDTVTACVYRLLHTGTDSIVIGLLLITAGMVATIVLLATALMALVGMTGARRND